MKSSDLQYQHAAAKSGPERSYFGQHNVCDGVPALASVSAGMLLSPGDEAAPGTVGTGEDVCPVCKGKGILEDGKDCPNCSGTGKIVEGIGGG